MRRFVTICALLTAAISGFADPADWWDARWSYRAEVPAEARGPVLEVDANFTVLMGRGALDPHSLRLVVPTQDGPVLAPLSVEPLPGWDPERAAVARVRAVLDTEQKRTPGEPLFLYFDTAEHGPWELGPTLDATQSQRNNLLSDGGFETLGDADSAWEPWGPGFSINEDAHAGVKAALIEHPDAEGVGGVFEQVQLDQTRPQRLVITGWSRAEGVSDDPNSDYSLWADLQYIDGTFLYGQAAPFDTGSHDWQRRELVIDPVKPVAWIKVFGLFRKHSGRAWFDDLSLRQIERYTLYAAERRDEAPERAAPIRLATEDGLALEFDGATGAVSGVALRDEDWTHSVAAAHSGLLLRDAQAGSPLLPVGGMVAAQDGGVSQQGSLPSVGLQAEVQYTAHRGAIEVSGVVLDTTGEDRCVDVVFRLPIRAEGKQWHRDLRESVDAELTGTLSESTRAGTQRVARYPFCALGDDAQGLSLALRMDEPATVTTSWENEGDVSFLQIRFAFGLSPAAGKHPSRAPFRFYIYSQPDAWGFRAAASKYYRMFPDFFRVRAERQGCWFFGTMDPTTIPNPEDFLFQFDEGPHNVTWDHERGIYAFPMSNAQELWIVVGDYEELAPEPPTNAEMTEALKGRGWPEELVTNCAIHDETGAIPWVGWHNQVWGGVAGRADRWQRMTYANADPELPSLNQWEKRNEWYDLAVKRSASQGGLDGLYIDQVMLVGAENYRRDHFAVADRPLSYSKRTLKPVLPVWMSSAEFHRAWSERIHAQGGLMQANIPPPGHIFYANLFDVLGSEVAPSRQTAAQTDLRRVFANRKPISLLMEWHWEGKPVITAEQMEGYFNRCLFWGIFPGISNAGPEGGYNYWQHPELYERDRPNWKRYMPAIHAVAMAGWQPLTGARCSDPGLWVESWGPDEDGRVYFTLRSEGETRSGELRIALADAGCPAQPVARDLLTGEVLATTLDGDALLVRVEVAADRSEAIVIEPSADEAAARSTLRRFLVAFQVQSAEGCLAALTPELREAYGDAFRSRAAFEVTGKTNQAILRSADRVRIEELDGDRARGRYTMTPPPDYMSPLGGGRYQMGMLFVNLRKTGDAWLISEVNLGLGGQ